MHTGWKTGLIRRVSKATPRDELVEIVRQTSPPEAGWSFHRQDHFGIALSLS